MVEGLREQWKNGDKVKFLEDLTYCERPLIDKIGYGMRIGGIALNNRWIDEVLENQVECTKIWNALETNGYTQKHNDEECFVIPLGTVATVKRYHPCGSVIDLGHGIEVILMLDNAVIGQKESEDDFLATKVS